MGGLLCLTSIFVCDVSLWGFYCGLVIFLKTSEKFLMDCNFLSPMDENMNVGYGFVISPIKYISVLIDYY